MGIIVLLALGGVLGWIAAIITCSQSAKDVAINIGVGMTSALIVGVLASAGALMAGLTVTVLLLAVTGSIVMLGGFNLARIRNAH